MTPLDQLRQQERKLIDQLNTIFEELKVTQQQLIGLGEDPLDLTDLPIYKTKPKASNTQQLLKPNATYYLKDKKFQSLFTTRSTKINFYLVHCVSSPIETHHHVFRLTFRCVHGDSQQYFDFFVNVFSDEIQNGLLLRLIKSKTDLSSLRFLKSILNNARENKLAYQYYYFMGSCIAINITNVYRGCKAIPRTYWFDIQTFESLNRFEFMELQPFKAFPFVENRYGY